MRHSQLTDDLQEQASLYAAGAMTESERQEYARHLEEDQCTVCRSEVNELQSAISMLAFSAPSAAPSPRVRERLLEQACSVAPPRVVPSVLPRPFFLRYWLPLLTSAVAIGAVAVTLAATQANNELRRLAQVLNSRIAQLEVEIADNRTFIATLTSPGVRVVNLAGQGANVQATARIFWDQSKGKWLLYVRNLPRLPADKTYQLWFVPVSGNPVSASVFNTANDGSDEEEINVPQGLAMLKAAAVTTEPAGGLPQPSGPFALLGAL
jgi:anti-sigma-K factor RskA